MRQLFDQAECHLGALDILVDNASVVVTASVAEATEQAYDRIMAVNAKGTSSPFQQAARRLRDGTASSTSPRSTPCCPGSGWDLYAASKAAVEQATLVAARELGRSGITINTVPPSCPIPRWSAAPTWRWPTPA